MDNKTARQDLETVIRVEDLALGSMRKLRGIQDWLRSHLTDTIPMPQSKEQARAMALTGMKWLEDNAPDQLVHVGGGEPVITNEMKAECMGEFEISITQDCGRCLVEGLDENCEQCDGELVYQRIVTVPWDTCKEIYKAMSALAPASPVRDTVCEVCGYMYGPTSCKCKKQIATSSVSAVPEGILTEKHNGMRISAEGVLGRVKGQLRFGAQEMLKHLEAMAESFYSGNVKAVDQFLQTWDLDDKRPQPAKQGEG